MRARVVASQNGSVGIQAALDVLTSGGAAVDAVVAGLSLVEANPEDRSVGYGGIPNFLGQVELDASVMIGADLSAGSVAALQHYQDAAKLAQMVMQELPHVLLVGAGANRLAGEMGLEEKNLLTPETEQLWKDGLEGTYANPEFTDYLTKMRTLIGKVTSDPQLVERPYGTVNFICQDREGRIASGVSTSGWGWKYPGRVGDSPIIGAGNYCDDRYGAAACTGRGELAQRACTAHSIVTFMRFGLSIEEAVRQALTDLAGLDDPLRGEMNVVALSREGEPWGAATVPGRFYVYQEAGMAQHEVRERVVVPIYEA
jgi:beta-aspartyl-peptidase (threonine type)